MSDTLTFNTSNPINAKLLSHNEEYYGWNSNKRFPVFPLVGKLDMKALDFRAVERTRNYNQPEIELLFKNPVEMKSFIRYQFDLLNEEKKDITFLDKKTLEIIKSIDKLLKEIYSLFKYEIRMKKVSHANQTIDGKRYFEY